MFRNFDNNGGNNSVVSSLDGEALADNDYPKKDFGPIGSSRKREAPTQETPRDMLGSEYIFSWASDFVNPGGRLVSEAARGTGLIPGLRHVTGVDQGLLISPGQYIGPLGVKSPVLQRRSENSSWTPFQSYGMQSPFHADEPRSPDGISGCLAFNSSPLDGSTGSWSPDSSSPESCVHPEERSDGAVLEGQIPSSGRTPGKKSCSKRTTANDMVDFGENYFLGTEKSSIRRRNRSGKYFKQFV